MLEIPVLTGRAFSFIFINSYSPHNYSFSKNNALLVTMAPQYWVTSVAAQEF